jgi:hypothetical protein
MADAKNDKKEAQYALGMTRQDGELAVRWSVNGVEEVRPLDVLREGKIDRETSRQAVETDLADWDEAPAEEWASGLGLGITPGDHRVWATQIGKLRALIPAHALLKGLLRPTQYVLVPIFRPQGIDGICTMVDGIPVPLQSWLEARTSVDSAVFRGPMSWFHGFPSARRMSASIYQLATTGVLGCDLAQGRLSLVLHGVKTADALFVTKLTVTAIRTDEAPFPFAEGTSGEISARDPAGRISAMPGIPLRGLEYRLSDDEWDAVGPLLPCRKSRVHPARELVDDLLSRACHADSTSTPNRALSKAASLAQGRWARSGHWQAFTQRLAALRGGAPSDEPPMSRKRARPTRGQNRPKPEAGLELEHYGPLDDHEWEHLQSLLYVQTHTDGRSSSRQVFDRMLEGLGAGNSWGRGREGEYTIGNAAAHRYLMFVQDGRWPAIAARLNLLRPRKSASLRD